MRHERLDFHQSTNTTNVYNFKKTGVFFRELWSLVA